MTTITSPYTGRTGTVAPRRTSRGWAFAGVASAAASVGGIVAGLSTDVGYDRKTAHIATAVRDQVGEHRGAILAFHCLTMISVLVLPVFAAGLSRRLRQRLPGDSLLPMLTLLGLGMVSMAGLLGTGLDTEFLNGPIDEIAPASTFAVYAHWIGTIPWLWAGAGIAALAVGVAYRTHRAVPRWLGVMSLIFGSLTVVFAASPLQYVSEMTGLVWLIAASLAFAVGDRQHA